MYIGQSKSHNMLMMAEVAQQFGDLDSCSGFPFENFLQRASENNGTVYKKSTCPTKTNKSEQLECTWQCLHAYQHIMLGSQHFQWKWWIWKQSSFVQCLWQTWATDQASIGGSVHCRGSYPVANTALMYAITNSVATFHTYLYKLPISTTGIIVWMNASVQRTT